jgi:AcrR family transcriptional regulator
MTKARTTVNSRLTMDDWIRTGYAILAEEGIKALKIDRLCSRLGVTKGRFYWQFTDIPGEGAPR